MDNINEFYTKANKYMPIFPKATGQPTVYIEGYPFADGEPMAETISHAIQINSLFDQLYRLYHSDPYILLGLDNFIYYSEGDRKKCVAPDIFVVLGAKRTPPRRSFYTWAEGATPDTIFEFLSDSTKNDDRDRKVQIYLGEMGAKEYFIHQPDLERPAEFRGWYRDTSGEIIEMTQDTPRTLFSEKLNLLFKWNVEVDLEVRLLRPYLPDGTPMTTSIEIQELYEEEKRLREEDQQQRDEAQQQRRIAEVKVEEQAEKIREQAAELEKLRQQLGK
ncbi:Uma2 family endonuclease [Candidatus Poribacteria bacterium]|nr:Uma2 family endonuclease [Candidatus Poribacteria bacterium]